MTDAPPVVNISPPSWDPYDSYGIIACQLARHLARRGVHVNAVQQYGLICLDTQDREVRAAIGKPIRPVLGGFLLGYPTEYPRRDYSLLWMGPRVAITMFESTRLPPGWASVLNECSAVITPTAWGREVFLDNGVSAPVEVIPLGISPTYRPVTRKAGRPYTFLVIWDGNNRKGWFEAADAFVKAFGSDGRTRLILKTRADVRLPRFRNRNIEVLAADLDEAGMQALYGRCDCMIWASKGEGFGLPPREFAATGGVVLAVDWSGSAAELEAWGWPLAYDLVPAWPNHAKHEGLGLWAQVDKADLVDKLRWVAGRPAEVQRRAGGAPTAIKRLYDWGAFADAAWAVWERVACLTSVPT